MMTREQALSHIEALYSLDDLQTVMEAIGELGAKALSDEALARIAELQLAKEQRLFQQSEQRRRQQ